MIPYGHQTIEDEDLQAVLAALTSDWLTQGPRIEKFEWELATYCGSKYCVAVNSGTAALHLAYLAAGIGVDDVVIVPANTFVATANAALYCGATPHLVDIDRGTFNISPSSVDQCLRDGKSPKAIVPVHFAGAPCQMEILAGIAQAHGAVLIEDACHALGAEWTDSTGKKQKVGNCSHSAMTCFSFHPVKHITTGEGGAILTNDEEIWRRLRQFRSHGIVKDSLPVVQDEPWYYEMQSLGFNYRITDFQSALGSAQLKRLDAWISRRRRIAEEYLESFSGHFECQSVSGSSRSSYHLFVIQVENRRKMFQLLRARGLGVQVHYIPVYRQPYYRSRFSLPYSRFPNCEDYYAKAISLPIYPGLSDAEVGQVVECVLETYAEAQEKALARS